MEYALLYELLCFNVNTIKKTHWAIRVFLCKLPSVNNFADTLWKTIKFIRVFTYIKFLFAFFPPRAIKNGRGPKQPVTWEIFWNQQTQRQLFHRIRRFSYVATLKKKSWGVRTWPAEKIVICLLKAFLGWFTLDVTSITCREHNVPTCLFLLCVCSCLQLQL